jgi:hypothetical protein
MQKRIYIQKYQQEGTLIQEQVPGDENPLFKIIIPTRINTQAQYNTDTPNPTTAQTATHS